jgi:hypothetical protein
MAYNTNQRTIQQDFENAAKERPVMSGVKPETLWCHHLKVEGAGGPSTSQDGPGSFLEHSVRFILLAVLAHAFQPPVAFAADEAKVLAAIEAHKQALLARISIYDEIEYRTSPAPFPPTKVKGTVTNAQGPVVRIKTLNGETVEIPRHQIVQWTTPGHIDPEMDSYFHTGPSALAAFALLSAGVETTQPRMAKLLAALAADQDPQMGTYVRSLRTAVWAALLDRSITRPNRIKYAKLLRDDMKWLMQAPYPEGTYGYTTHEGGMWWDNSNTQFANLGLWAGSVANVEVADKHWLSMAQHWLRSQTPSGGWAYREEFGPPTPSMTVAGCNSLIIVLDRFYAKAEGPYALFKGARSKPSARKEMQKIYRAIEAGDGFLRLNPPNVMQSWGYELFGLERLGLASGRAVIGGVDWFREHAESVADRAPGQDPISDAFALIFLVHGQAPVLIQKLEHGSDAEEWNYYSRDLAGLCRYMSRTFERLYRWQRLPADASLRELEDAPILYISGQQKLSLSPEMLERIRRYIERGGTVFLHADRASKVFTDSAVDTFQRLFADRQYRFETLEDSHPVFTCHFDKPQLHHEKRLALKGMSDGSRIPVFLCPVDIAGAWHQQRRDTFEDLFQMMVNLRMYAAPPYSELPSRLRSEPLSGPPARSRGTLSIQRLPHKGNWNAHAGAWERYGPGLRHRSGIDLTVDASDSPIDAEALRESDLVHLTLQHALHLDDQTRQALRDYLQGGGLLLVDAADGQPAGITAVRRFSEQLGIGVRGILPLDHPIVTGKIPAGQPLLDLRTTSAGASLTSGSAPPPIITITIDGRLAVLACPFDLIAGIDGPYIWNRSGYLPASTALIVDNILSWRFEQVSKRSTRPAVEPPEE